MSFSLLIAIPEAVNIELNIQLCGHQLKAISCLNRSKSAD